MLFEEALKEIKRDPNVAVTRKRFLLEKSAFIACGAVEKQLIVYCVYQNDIGCRFCFVMHPTDNAQFFPAHKDSLLDDGWTIIQLPPHEDPAKEILFRRFKRIMEAML